MKTLEEYMKLYGSEYDSDARNAIYYYFNTDIPIDISVQIKSKLGLIDKEKDIYERFIKKLDEHDMLHGRVLEVGCGFYPTMAEKIISTHDISLTAIDPRLVTRDIEGLTLIKGRFPENVDTHSYDRIISLLPGDATIPIIKKSYKANKEYFLALCKCTHFKNPGRYMPCTYEKWENYVKDIAYNNLEGNMELSLDYLDEASGDRFLILSKKCK